LALHDYLFNVLKLKPFDLFGHNFVRDVSKFNGCGLPQRTHQLDVISVLDVYAWPYLDERAVLAIVTQCA
jgi:hypothetical protein